MYASVVVDTGASSSIESLTYEVPDGLADTLQAGACVLVPLGARQAVGYVVGFEDHTDIENTRPITAAVQGPVRLSPEMLDLARWISDHYLCSFSRVVAAMVPGVVQSRVKPVVSAADPPPDDLRLTPSERQLYDSIKAACGEVPVDDLRAGMSRTALQRLIRELEKKGAVSRTWRVVPPAGKPRRLTGVGVAEDVVADESLLESLPARQKEALELILRLGRETAVVELERRHGISRSVIQALQKKGVLRQTGITFRRAPEFVSVDSEPPELTREQKQAVDVICSAVDSGGYSAHLIHGVTASGKTETYLRCIEHVLSKGRTCLVLLPEIAITTQLMNVFKSRFGDRVAVMHSALSAGERFDEWVRVQSGEAVVVVGARSAVFAPLENLGLIVVDEEHDGSYKQDSQPRYHAREAAVQRARRNDAVLVLGSATPSIVSYHAAREGSYRLIKMPSRVESRPMPRVHVADLRQQYKEGRATIFSHILEELIRERLECRQQVILLQNRRAYSTFLLCRECGHVMRCPNCAVSLKFYSADRKLACHHCDYSRPAPTLCPQCGGRRIGKFGIGTERVEAETKAAFPEARVIRMDRDTTSRRGSHAAILNAFRRGEADILVGTQMIAKGLDFPNVTLVGVISADTSLNLPDFSAAERTFQLISQVAGRAGRGPAPGEVVIQTFDPDNYAIQCAVRHDYEGFYQQEIENRRELGYPPFTTLVNVVSSDPDERAALRRLSDLAAALNASDGVRKGALEILGPMPAVLARLRGEYRYHLVVRSRDRNAAVDLLRGTLARVGGLQRGVAVDVDPVSML